MGETLQQRAEFAAQLAELEPDEVPPELPRSASGDTVRGPRGHGDDGRVARDRRVSPCSARTVLRYAGGRELTLGDLGTRQGVLGGIDAMIVGNYLTTLGRSAQDDLDLLAELKMPVKELSKTL